MHHVGQVRALATVEVAHGVPVVSGTQLYLVEFREQVDVLRCVVSVARIACHVFPPNEMLRLMTLRSSGVAAATPKVKNVVRRSRPETHCSNKPADKSSENSSARRDARGVMRSSAAVVFSVSTRRLMMLASGSVSSGKRIHGE